MPLGSSGPWCCPPLCASHLPSLLLKRLAAAVFVSLQHSGSSLVIRSSGMAATLLCLPTSLGHARSPVCLWLVPCLSLLSVSGRLRFPVVLCQVPCLFALILRTHQVPHLSLPSLSGHTGSLIGLCWVPCLCPWDVPGLQSLSWLHWFSLPSSSGHVWPPACLCWVPRCYLLSSLGPSSQSAVIFRMCQVPGLYR